MNILELTEENFKEYGTVIDFKTYKDVHRDEEFNWYDEIVDTSNDITINNLTCKKRELVLSQMEKHSLTTETVFPLNGDIIVAVANGETPKVSEVKLFKLKQGQGATYNKDVWHYIPFPINEEDVESLILFKKNTGSNDLLFVPLDKKIKLD